MGRWGHPRLHARCGGEADLPDPTPRARGPGSCWPGECPRHTRRHGEPRGHTRLHAPLWWRGRLCRTEHLVPVGRELLARGVPGAPTPTRLVVLERPTLPDRAPRARGPGAAGPGSARGTHADTPRCAGEADFAGPGTSCPWAGELLARGVPAAPTPTRFVVVERPTLPDRAPRARGPGSCWPGECPRHPRRHASLWWRGRLAGPGTSCPWAGELLARGVPAAPTPTRLVVLERPTCRTEHLVLVGREAAGPKALGVGPTKPSPEAGAGGALERWLQKGLQTRPPDGSPVARSRLRLDVSISALLTLPTNPQGSTRRVRSSSAAPRARTVRTPCVTWKMHPVRSEGLDL
jgi:hypothetical protein